MPHISIIGNEEDKERGREGGRSHASYISIIGNEEDKVICDTA